MKEVKIRKAVLSDKSAISRLTKKYPDTLDRSPREIEKMIGSFFVAADEEGKINGCCGFKMWEKDAEIVSWIVAKEFQGMGIGRKLLERTLEKLEKKKGIKNIFIVTVPALAQKYFEPLGFLETGLQMFSGKVFADCRRCPKNRFRAGHYQCNEIALVLRKR